MTVKQLQVELKAHGVKTTGVKAMLQTRLKELALPVFGGIKFSRELVLFARETMA